MKYIMFALFACLPLHHLRVNSGFGPRRHPLTGVIRFHEGVDLHAHGDTVFSVLNGKVRNVGQSRSLGLFIILEHASVETVYAHLSQAFVSTKEEVVAGQPMAITGATGRTTGEHLHFAVTYRGRYIDPILFLKMLLQENEDSAAL